MKKRAVKGKLSKSRAAKRRPNKTAGRRKKTVVNVAKDSSTQTKALVHRWFEELWNKRNPGILDELLDPAAVGETEGGTVTGHREFIDKLHAPLIGAFSDLRVTLDDVIAEGDNAAVRWTFIATHSGDTLGIPASKRRVKVSGMSWVRSKNGRLIAGWDRWNSAGLLSFLTSGTPSATVREHVDG
jgi:predicted ester cyclase